MPIPTRASRLYDPSSGTPVAGSPPLLPFASFPAASSVPGQVRRASDLNGAYLVSDGVNWGPLNGRAVLANVPNANITIQGLSRALITKVAFPAGFMRAGSRIQIWAKYKCPAIGTGLRSMEFFASAPAAGVPSISNRFAFYGSNISSINTSARINTELVALGVSGTHRGSPGAVSANGGFGTDYPYPLTSSYAAPTVDFAAPWEITFTGVSAAETAQTAVTATWAAGVATFAKTDHGYAVGDKVVNTLFDLSGYNGTLIVTGAPTADTWTAAIAADPGGAGTGGSTSRISNVTLVDYLIEWLQ